MSPEQVEGRSVDERSDIFSFGLLLYEMFTGRQAFKGQSKASTMVAILTQEPPAVGELVEGLPPEAEKIIARCLRKDPSRRIQHMDDVKLALEELKSELESGITQTIAIPQPARYRTAFVAIAVLLVAVFAGYVLWKSRPRTTPVGTPVLRRLTSNPGLSGWPALSKDGKFVAYASDRGTGNLDIWLQQIGGEGAVRLTDDPADDYDPSFSPDGTQIAFRSERAEAGIYIVAAIGGGTARLIAPGGRGPRFSPVDSRIAYWTGEFLPGTPQGSAKMHVIEPGGAPSQPFHPEFPLALHPVWSPDGSRLLFFGMLNGKIDWFVTSLSGKAPVSQRSIRYILDRKLKAPPGLPWPVPSAWLPDPDRVLFAASLGDSTNRQERSRANQSGRLLAPVSRPMLRSAPHQ
jgi:hypothetical protein